VAGETTQHIAKTLVDHLPILPIVIPLIAAPLCVIIGSQRLAWPIAFIASVASFVISALLLAEVSLGGYLSYHIGGWAPPLGIEYRIDAANALVLFLVSGISSVVLVYAYESIKTEIPERNHELFYACFLLCLTGLMGVAVTGDAFNIFVFLEISSLSTYVLVAQGSYSDKRALTAAYDYLIMGTIGATFFVIGLGFLFMATGTLNIADLAERIETQGHNRTVQAAFAFIVVGLGLKAAMYPMHLWLPNAYTFAPSAVTAFLAATATKVAIYVLIRFLFSVFHPGFEFEIAVLKWVVVPLGIIAMFVASFVAVFQTDMKRMLAYSSIAQIGYMLLGIGLLSATGLTAAIIHLFNHGITKAVLFMGVGALVLGCQGSFYDRIQGMGKSMPWTSAAIVIGGVSLIGVPGTAGFVSKWLLVQAALEKGWWPISILIVLSSLLAVIYVWRVIEVLYVMKPVPGLVAKDPPLTMLAPMWVMALACIYFGIDTDVTLTAARSAAESLMARPMVLH
jgi:multicomponent Na+:H+ antiporter subunit D